MRRLAAGLFTLAGFAAASLCAPQTSTTKSDLIDIYKKLDEFASHNDNASMEAYYTPDWTAEAPGEKPRTLKQVKEVEAKSKASDSLVSQRVSRVFRELSGSDTEAVITFEVTIDAEQKDLTGQLGEKGQIHKITATATIRDTWIKTPDGWKQRRHVKLTPNKIKIDGKPA